MNRDALLKPLQVRFTEPADADAYGSDWWTYDELALVTMPARDLIPLEAELGITLVDMMSGVRASSVVGDTAAAWIAIRMAGQPLPFDKFSPAIMLAEWRSKPEEVETPKEDGAVSLPTPEDLATDTPEFLETAPDPTPIYSVTAPADSVVLPIMPAAESPSSSPSGDLFSRPAWG